MIKTIFGSTIEFYEDSDGKKSFYLTNSKNKIFLSDEIFIKSDFNSLKNVHELSTFYDELLNNKTKFFTVVIYFNNLLTDNQWDFQSEIIQEHVSIFPGSFNPLTEAHLTLMQSSILEDPPRSLFIEISLNRRGKDSLSFEELYDRLKQFIQCNFNNKYNFGKVIRIIVTNSEFFYQKIEAINSSVGGVKNQTYHIGIDTLQRLYEDHGISFINNLMCNFIVYDRVINGTTLFSFDNMKDKELYTNVKRAKYQLPENLLAVSSSAIRQQLEDEGTKLGNV